MAPSGFEITAKKALSGLKLAYGPQLWWGANPAVFLKYQRGVGPFALTGIFHEDVAPQSSLNTSIAIPMPETRKASLQMVTSRGPWTLEGGSLWSGSTKVGDDFQIAEKTGTTYRVLQDEIKDEDAWGFKGKLTVEKGSFRWYAQGANMGLVSDAGPTEVITFTGWRLKDSGSGNQKNVISGFTYNRGSWQIGPNFLWQKPIVGPVPGDVPAPGRPRNFLADPFAVRENREMTGYELLLTYDPEPATWFYAWDNDRRETARMAASLGFVYKDMPTTRDAGIYIAEDGFTTYPFSGAHPGAELWEAHARIAGKLGQRTRLVANIYAGMFEPNGWDYPALDTDGNSTLNRIIHRYGAAARLTHGSLALAAFVKINDWGVYDYHRDWNLTFPLQAMVDLSKSLGERRWFGLPETRLGVRGTYRTLDENSNRHPSQDEEVTGVQFEDGNEWEIRTYMHLVM